jgi:hypothetical protein
MLQLMPTVAEASKALKTVFNHILSLASKAICAFAIFQGPPRVLTGSNLERSHATDYRLPLGKRRVLWQFTHASPLHRFMPTKSSGGLGRKNIKKIHQHALQGTTTSWCNHYLQLRLLSIYLMPNIH